MTVRSFISCPLCGEEMRLMSGSFYYSIGCGLVELECEHCNLSIKEYNFENGFNPGEKNSYHKLVKKLVERVRK